MPIVDIHHICKAFKSLHALKDVSLHIEKGEFFGLLGPNGAGKTTLISILAGLVRADSGFVKINGFDTVSQFKNARKSLGIVPQELVYDPFFTVRETLEFQSGYFGVKNNERWINDILENLGLMQQAETNSRILSGGMKRRLLIAQALVHRPPVIVLDEPTAGVDVELRQILWRFIQRLNKEGHTILLTTHYLEEAQFLCNRVAVMRGGEIAILDTIDALLNRFANQKLIIRIRSGTLPDILRMRCIDFVSTKNQATDFSVDTENALECNTFCFSVQDMEDMKNILQLCWASGCNIEDIEVKKTTLEDVFFQITKNLA